MSDKAEDLLSKLVLVMEPQPMNYETFQIWEESAKYLEDKLTSREEDDFVTNDSAPDHGAMTAALFELEHAAKVFRTYENLERNKNTSIGNYKAEANKLHAERIETVLSDIFDGYEFSLSDSVEGCEPCQGDIYAKVAAEFKKPDNPWGEADLENKNTAYDPWNLPGDLPARLGDYRKAADAAASIISSFNWQTSSEGSDFWRYVYLRLNEIHQLARKADIEKSGVIHG